MRRALLAFSVFVGLLLGAPTSGAANKLWIAWDGNTATCKSKVTDFFKCILDQSNFDQLATAYPNGESLTLAGTHTLTKYCAPKDFTCVVNDAGFAITKYDIVLHYYGSGWVGGTNGTQTVNGVFINTAWVEAGTNCNGQTCTGAHEAYEAATDGISADCCNGQVHSASCSACDSSCGQYTGNSGNPPWGCYDLVCPNGTYKMELLSKYGNELDATGCTKVTVQSSSCGVALNQPCKQLSDCCSGLVCAAWDYDGSPPYSTYCCKAIGASCANNTDCCGGSNCNAGKCGCVPSGEWCLNADDCCAGSSCDLSAHKCVSTAIDAGSGGNGGAAGQSGASGASSGGTSAGGASAGGSGGFSAGGKLDGGIMKSDAGYSKSNDDLSDDSGGCGCRATQRTPHSTLALALLALCALVRRRTHTGDPCYGLRSPLQSRSNVSTCESYDLPPGSERVPRRLRKLWFG